MKWILCFEVQLISINHLITGMYEMFRCATDLNQQLDDWDVAVVKDMKTRFYGATNFNQPLNDCKMASVSYKLYVYVWRSI